MVLVDNTIINSQMQMDDMVPYNKISNLTRVTLLHLPKDIYQLVNKLNHYKGCNSVQNSSIRGYQECPSNFRERYLSCYWFRLWILDFPLDLTFYSAYVKKMIDHSKILTCWWYFWYINGSVCMINQICTSGY